MKPQAICIEEIREKAKANRFTRCVALPGRQPGLKLDASGNILWRTIKATVASAAELWVSEDNRLILYRPEGAPPVTVHRAGRSLQVPYSKPVVLINLDQITLNSRELRIHLHGETSNIIAPAPLTPESESKFRKPKILAQGAALAALIGALTVSGGCVEVRENPPAPLPYDDPIEEELEQPEEQQSVDQSSTSLQQNT